MGPALTLAAGRTRYTLRLLPADDYPALPELTAPAGQADAGAFAAAVRQAAVAASRDDTLPALCTVQATFTGEALTLVATDRYRAALRRLPWQPSGPDLPPPVLIPVPALAEVARAAGPDPVRVHVLTGPGGTPAVAGFTFGAQAITTRLTAADYPNMARMIPAGFAATAVLDAAELAEAVKRLAVVAARDTPIHLSFSPGQVELTAGSADEADGTDTVGCELDGDPVTVAFHPRRLLDALTATGTGRARIALTGPGKAALITPAGDDGPDDGRRTGLPAPAHAHPHRRVTGPPPHHPHGKDHPRMSAGDTTLTITGNLTGDPELRFTGTGTAVVAFTVAASRRVYDQATGQMAGRRHAVPALLGLARAGRPRRRIPDQGDAGHRHRPPQAAQLRNHRRGKTDRLRGRRRRRRPLAEVGHRQNRQDQPGQGAAPRRRRRPLAGPRTGRRRGGCRRRPAPVLARRTTEGRTLTRACGPHASPARPVSCPAVPGSAPAIT